MAASINDSHSGGSPPGGHTDVLIVGGGVAGCASALTLLRAGRSVTVVERSSRRGPRFGEILPPHAKPQLAGFGLLERFLGQGHLPSSLVQCEWGQDDLRHIDLTFHPYGPSWHLDRVVFDAMWMTAVEEKGANIVHGTSVKSLSRRADDCWEILLTGSAGESQLSASFVIDATGRASSVARRLGCRRRSYDLLAGLVTFLEIGPRTAAAEVATVIEAVADGWWYAGRLPGQRIVAAFMTDSDLLPSGRTQLPGFWRDHLESTAHVSRMWRNAAQPSPRLVRANTSRLEEFVGDRWLAVGDAAMSYDPLSSQGICRALESGGDGGQAAHHRLAGDGNALGVYAAAREEIFGEYLRQRAYYYEREHRWSASPFWRRRHETAQQVIP